MARARSSTSLLFDDLPKLPNAAVTRRPRRPVHRPAPAVAAAEQWPLHGKINVVLFAGMGGACQGLEAAGFPVHIAVNHDEVAIAAHKALNPHTRHLHADIFEVDPVEAVQGRPVGILWGSPDCTHHSVAKGGAPVSPRVRSLPWQMCRWVGALHKRGLGPDVFFLENVREIRSWGPLVAKRDKATGRVLKLDGTVAEKGEVVPRHQQQLIGDRRRKGRTYRAWVRHLQGIGVRYEDRDANCAEHCIPTSRKRLFGTGVFDKPSPNPLDQLPIVWPTVTHGLRRSEAVKLGKLLPFRQAAECIDWSLALPSIFDRPRPLAIATQKRVAVGMKRFVLEAARPFLIHLTHGARIHDTGNPAPTITSAHRGELAVVGAAVVPTSHTGADRVHDPRAPMPTQTAGVKGGELMAMGATIIGAGGRAAQSHPMDMEDPLNTTTTKEDRCVVGATLIGVAHGDDSRSGSRAYDIQDALRTATGSNDQAVIAAHLTRYHGERRPGEARGIELPDPLATQTTENRFGIVAAHLTKFQENSVGQHPEEPIDTVMAGAARFGVVGAFLEEAHGNSTGRDVAEPLPAQTQGPHHYAVGAFLEEHRSRSIGQQVDAPLSTQTQREHQAVIGAAMIRTDMHQSNATCAYDGADPVNTITTSGGHAVMGAALVQTGYGEREGQAPRALDVEDPLGSQVAGGAKHAVMGAWMVKNSTDVVGLPMSDSMSTIVTTVGPQAIGAAYMTEFRGTSADGQPVTEPAGSICTGGNRGGGHDAVTAGYLCEYYSTGGQHQGVDALLNTAPTRGRFAVTGADLAAVLSPEKLARARQVAEFLRSYGCWDGGEVVTFGHWIVVDIGMRMLTPKEAAAAHELKLPDLITIAKRDRKGQVVLGEDGKPVMIRRPLTKTEAMRLVGNSVPMRMAKLLVEANRHHTTQITALPSIAAA